MFRIKTCIIVSSEHPYFDLPGYLLNWKITWWCIDVDNIDNEFVFLLDGFMMWKFVQSHIILSYFGPTSTSTQYGPTPSERLLVVEAVKLVVEEDRTPDFFELQLCKTNRVGTSENIKTKTGKFIFQPIDFQVRTCSLFPKNFNVCQISDFNHLSLFQSNTESTNPNAETEREKCNTATLATLLSATRATLSYSCYSSYSTLSYSIDTFLKYCACHAKRQKNLPASEFDAAKKNIWRETSSSFDTLKLKVDDFFES